MNCGRFLLLLEAGDTGSLDSAALGHAASCELCGRALAEARALERSLEAHLAGGPGPVPADFTNRLMARVETMPQVRVAPADVVRATLAAFATPPIAASVAAAAALLGFAAAYGFDPARMSAAAGNAMAPLTRAFEGVARPLPASGLAYDFAVAGVLLAGLPVLAVLVAAAWQLGTAIGERTPRAL
jgi:hypothetical protein